MILETYLIGLVIQDCSDNKLEDFNKIWDIQEDNMNNLVIIDAVGTIL